MFKIIINLFQKDFICILMFMIIIHVFQINIIFMFKIDHSFNSKGFYLHFNGYDYNSCISNGY